MSGIRHSGFGGDVSRVTLTFDNGPSADTTPFVLAELLRRGLNAYFCVVGSQLKAAEEHVNIAQEALRLGHCLVNHSLTHGVALGDEPTEEHALQEITNMHELMVEKLGGWGPSWFRPFGRGGELGPHIFSDHALNQLQALEYSVLLWNCVPRDWEDTKGWVGTALNQIEKNEHTVVVLHDIGTGAMANLPMFLDELDRRNAEITLQLPTSCVPLRKGKYTITDVEMEKLTSTFPTV